MTVTAERGGLAAELAAVAERVLGGPLPVGLRAWDGSTAGAAGRPGGPAVPTIVLASPRALRRLLWHPGELGLAQAYVTGELDVEGDLAAGLRLVRAAPSGPGAGSRRTLAAALPLAVRALASSGRWRDLLGPPLPPPPSQARLPSRLRSRLHSPSRDRAAIAHHYDLSNDFYALILDEHLAYSCGYWTSDDPAYTITDAQADKLAMVCRKLGLRPGQRLLDVGCGWGSLSLYAARELGVRVTGITLSARQAEFVAERAARAGLGDRVQVRLKDYRALERPGGQAFDAVASLEMGEHVGQSGYPGYAETLCRMVAPGGRVLVQQMSRGVARSAREGRDGHPGGGEFIEAYIAPDMHMRPVGETVAFLERAGLEVRDVHGMREHYARTAAAWLATLESRWDAVVSLVGEEMARVWRLYLVGGGLAFEEGRMGVDQILAVRPGPGGRSGMPPVRAS